MAAVEGALTGLEHGRVGAQRETVVAGQALAAGQTATRLGGGLFRAETAVDLGVAAARPAPTAAVTVPPWGVASPPANTPGSTVAPASSTSM